MGRSGTAETTPTYKPNLINVIKEYAWTLSPVGIARDEVPPIILTEYKTSMSGLVGAFGFWGKMVSDAYGKITQSTFLPDYNTGVNYNPYGSLYPSNPTGYVYRLPYFSDHYRDLRNDWSESNMDIRVPWASNVPIAGEYFTLDRWETLAKTIFTGVGHEVPKAYTGGSVEEIPVNFVLLNTTTPDDITKNIQFINTITYQNLQRRINAIILEPPVFYQLEIPGIKKSPAAFLANFSVASLGQTKLVAVKGMPGKTVIPEAFGIAMRFVDLIPQSQNMMDTVLTGKSIINVTENVTDSRFAVTKPTNPVDRIFPKDKPDTLPIISPWQRANQ